MKSECIFLISEVNRSILLLYAVGFIRPITDCSAVKSMTFVEMKLGIAVTTE